jgi:hypothetical protein
MTDRELDEMLNQWDVPPMRESLRDELRAEFIAIPAKPRRQSWLRRMIAMTPRIRMSRLAAATMGAGALLFAIVQVSPRTVRMASPGFQIPFYVEFEFTRYQDDGSLGHRSWMKSFPYGGYEVAMSVREPGDSFLNVFRNFASSIRDQFVLAMPELLTSKMPPWPEPAWFTDFVRSGCTANKNVVGHETILGHETAIIETGSPGYRLRIWQAPDLNCFALRLIDEKQQSNGGYRVRIRKEAIQVRMNP